MSSSWNYIAKLVCIGDSSCGKSSLVVRLCESRFSLNHDVTIGIEFNSRVVPVGPPANLQLRINDPSRHPNASDVEQARPENTPKTTKSKNVHPNPASSQKFMKLSIWDTAGQEAYKAVTRSYFRNASGALLVFDISRRSTFESTTSWLHDLRQIATEDIVVVLVGNKSDLAGTSRSLVDEDGNEPQPNKRAVSQEEAKEWCRRNGVMQYVETSAKSGDGVEQAFLEVAERIYQNIEANKYDLNDRRSGVKATGTLAGARRTGRTSGNEVILGVNKVGGMNKDGKRGWNGGCC